MNHDQDTSCHWCSGTVRLHYCHSCTLVSCIACVKNIDIFLYYCNACEKNVNEPVCGSCGNKNQMVDQVTKNACANCESTKLSDPDVIIRNLPSDYYDAVTKVPNILPKINELTRSFEFFTALVRQCRIAGLLAFPQIETTLSRCAKGMNQINKRTIDHLTKVRKEALFEIFNISYFKNIKINQYRSAERLVQNIEAAICQTSELVTYWVEQVNEELDKLYRLSDPLRKHYELMQQISRYLPEKIVHIAGIVPAVSCKVKQGRNIQKGDSYIVFSENEVVFLPVNAVSRNEISVGCVFRYDSIKSVVKSKSSLKGLQLSVQFKDGESLIIAPPKVLDAINHYFELVQSEEAFMIGSAKTILKIEAEAADKFAVKRACDKFVNLFNERLFGTEQKFDTSPTMSMTDLQNKFKDLKNTSKEIDNRARNLQINLDDYRQYRHQINDSLRNLRNDFSRMGGHFAQKKAFDNWKLDNELEEYDYDSEY